MNHSALPLGAHVHLKDISVRTVGDCDGHGLDGKCGRVEGSQDGVRIFTTKGRSF